MEIASRPAVRIICFDAGGRVLLLCWQDPYDGARLWEPPGGGIEPGETPYQAACRELAEETGLDPAAIVDRPVDVERDTIWNGRRFIGVEQFFVARYPRHEPPVSRLGLLQDEQQNVRGHGWLHTAEFALLDGRIEPPTLATIAARLDAGSA